MEQNNFPPGGLFRKERQFLSDYRERAHCIGKYQLVRINTLKHLTNYTLKVKFLDNVL